MRAALLATALAAMTLPGCIPPADPAKTPPPAEADACGASKVQKYLGFVAGDDLVTTIRRESGAELIRRYTTGDPVTMDYRATRLNIEVGTNGRIATLGCG